MEKLRILLIHNFYRQSGGEDAVFNAEKGMLIANGHEVIDWTDTNNRVETRFSSAVNAVWSFSSFKKAEESLAQMSPDIVHIHNTWMVFSPSIYYAFQKGRVPVVQTLHNYRLLCPNALFFRANMVCEDCIHWPVPLPGIIHGCYRGSRMQTVVISTMLGYHRLIETWNKQIDAYITLSDFSRNKFIEGGLPSQKIYVKPNFLPDVRAPSVGVHQQVLYAGRLSPEKGLKTLEHAWRMASLDNIPLCVAGDGPEKDTILRLVKEKKNVRYLGQLTRPSLDEFIIRSRFIVIPTLCYENFPMSILDSFRLGIPVIASRIGAASEIIREGETGLLFTPGDYLDFASKVQWLWDNPNECARMGHNARREYEEKYTPELNYQMLMDIYNRTISQKQS